MGVNDDDERIGRGELADPLDGTVPVNEPKAEYKLKKVYDLTKNALEVSFRRFSGAEQPIPLPWAKYARILGGGLWRGLHVIVAGTGKGKSTFALQIALGAAKAGHPVCYVGLELDETQIGARIAGEYAGISWSDLYLGKIRGWQIENLHKQLKDLEGWPLYAEFGAIGGWRPESMVAMAEALQAQADGKTSLIVLDYLQIVAGGPKVDTRERVTNAANIAREVARKFNVSVLVISSTARQHYDKLNDCAKQAKLLDNGMVGCPDVLVGTGKESGEIEYDADSVTVIGSDANMVCVVVPKLRTGLPGWVPMRFEKCRFVEKEDGVVGAKKPDSDIVDMGDMP